jgi:hypothetical protein
MQFAVPCASIEMRHLYNNTLFVKSWGSKALCVHYWQQRDSTSKRVHTERMRTYGTTCYQRGAAGPTHDNEWPARAIRVQNDTQLRVRTFNETYMLESNARMDLHKYDLHINPEVHVSNGDFDVLMITEMHIFVAGRTAFFGFVLGAQTCAFCKQFWSCRRFVRQRWLASVDCKQSALWPNG